MKKSFEVEVTRIGYAYKTITVEAESQEEADQTALDEAGNEEFSERESDYILPNSEKPYSVQIIMGETAHQIFNQINGATTIDEIKAKIAKEYGEDQVENDMQELDNYVESKSFGSKEEMDSFLEGFNMASGYLESTAYITPNETLKVLLENQ